VLLKCPCGHVGICLPRRTGLVSTHLKVLEYEEQDSLKVGLHMTVWAVGCRPPFGALSLGLEKHADWRAPSQSTAIEGMLASLTGYPVRLASRISGQDIRMAYTRQDGAEKLSDLNDIAVHIPNIKPEVLSYQVASCMYVVFTCIIHVTNHHPHCGI
jgi:hypothetical protein